MFFADPDDLYTATEFHSKVREIVDWFQPLNPYTRADPPPKIFTFEKANFKLKDDKNGKTLSEFEPLWCLAISAKRYVLYNRNAEGKIVIRKASAHGLGDIAKVAGYDRSKHERTRAEHVAAPLDNKGERVYSKLVQGSNARLFLDLWRIAIEEYEAGTPENIDRIVEVLHGLDAPKVTQTSLSTKHLWKTYESLPKRSPFQFFLTLGKLIAGDNYSERVMPDERRALLETSLYASFTKDFKLKTLEEYLALGEGNEGLYRRDTGKFPAQAFDPLWNVKFQTIADRIQGYFSHGEPKSHGWTGKLNRKTVVGIDKEWIGKESHPLRSDIEVNEDDDAAMEESGFNVPILRRDFNARLIYAAGIEAVAKAIRISPKSLESSLRHGRKPAPAIVHRICARFRSIRMAPLS